MSSAVNRDMFTAWGFQKRMPERGQAQVMCVFTLQLSLEKMAKSA